VKVSGQGLKQVNKEKIKAAVDEKNAKTTPLKDGETYKGKLTSVDGAKVKVNINGKEYSATINNGSLSGRGVGDQIEFKATVNGSEVLLDIKGEDNAVKTKGLDNLIMNLGVEKTDENKAIINLLKEFKIPITKEIFEEIKSLVKSKDLMISTLSKNLESGSTSVDLAKVINKELGLKENLINIFKSEAASVNYQSSKPSLNNETLTPNTQTNSATTNMVGAEINANASTEAATGKTNESIEIKLVDVNGDLSSVKENIDGKESSNSLKGLVNESEKEILSELAKTNEKSELAQKEVLNLKNEQVNQNSVENANNPSLKAKNEEIKGLLKIIDSLKNIDESTFAFNKEMQIPNVVKNLLGFDNLINMKDSVVSQLRNVLDAALEHGADKAKLTAILEELIGIKSDDFERLNSLLAKTRESFESQKTPLTEGLKEDISLLKDSIDYIKEVNNQLVYMQTPIDINGEIRDFEMGIKKSKDSKDGTFKIFISLDTANIGLVQSLIKIKDTEIDIGFKVEEEFDYYFSDNHELMAYELTSLGYTKINFSNIIREKKLNLTDLLKSDVKEERQFDFLV